MKLETDLDSLVFDSLNIIQKYIRTMQCLFFHPSDLFTTLGSNSNNSRYLKPGLFLITNLLISSCVDVLFGYSLDKSPIKDVVLNKLITDFSYEVIRYAVGYFVLCWLIYYFINKFYSSYFSFKNVLTIICYGSFIYLPMVIVGFLQKIITTYCGNSNTLSIFGDFIYNKNLDTFKNFLNAGSYWALTDILFALLLVFLWLKIIDLGSNLIGKGTKRRALFVSLVLYFFINLLFLITTSFIFNYQTLLTIYEIRNNYLNTELSKDKPNLAKVGWICADVGDDSAFPLPIRYDYGLVQNASILEELDLVNNKGLTKTVYDLIKKGKNYEAYKLIEKNIIQKEPKEFDKDYTLYQFEKRLIENSNSLKDGESNLDISELRADSTVLFNKNDSSIRFSPKFKNGTFLMKLFPLF